MISQDRLEKSMAYLATTDEEAAELLTEVERREYKAKAVRDTIFLHEAGTVAERTAKAGASQEYMDAMAGYFESVAAFHAVKNKRNTETLVIDVWRSLNANRRQG